MLGEARRGRTNNPLPRTEVSGGCESPGVLGIEPRSVARAADVLHH